MEFYLKAFLNYLPSLIGLSLSLILLWFISAFIEKKLYHYFCKTRLDTTLSHIIAKFLRYGVLFVGLTMALHNFGIETAGLLAMVASLGVGIGLALQGTLANIASGLMLLLLRPFKEGDYIIVDGHNGVVNNINLFTITLDTFDGRAIILPNSNVFGKNIENHSKHSLRTCLTKFKSNANFDAHKTQQLLLAKMQKINPTDIPPKVYLVGLEGDYFSWEVALLCAPKEISATREQVFYAIEEVFKANGLAEPTPVYKIIQEVA